MFGFLPPTRPVVAQGHSLMISSSVRRGLNGGRTTLLHHLPDGAVGKDHRRVTVTEREFKGKVHEISHFLNGRRSEYNQVIVSVTASLAGLEIVRLARLDGSKAGTSTHNVHDKGRKLGSSHIGQTLPASS